MVHRSVGPSVGWSLPMMKFFEICLCRKLVTSKLLRAWFGILNNWLLSETSKLSFYLGVQKSQNKQPGGLWGAVGAHPRPPMPFHMHSQFWDIFRTILGWFWDHFEIILGQFWGRFWGWFWANFGMILETILGPFRPDFGFWSILVCIWVDFRANSGKILELNLRSMFGQFGGRFQDQFWN